MSGVRVTKGKITDSKCMKEIQGKSIALYVSGKLFTYRFPKPKFCPKGEVSINVGLGEGYVGSFPETHDDPIDFGSS